MRSAQTMVGPDTISANGPGTGTFGVEQFHLKKRTHSNKTHGSTDKHYQRNTNDKGLLAD
jgi:hypothetical protein